MVMGKGRAVGRKAAADRANRALQVTLGTLAFTVMRTGATTGF